MAGSGFIAVLWVAAGVVAVLGALLLVLALRGRRVNDHPVCRRCQFDLVGLMPAAANCPECGARLGGKNAVRVGARVRRYGGLRGVVVAAAVLLIGVVGLGGLGVVAASGVNIYAKLPTAVLEMLSRAGDSAGVLDELLARAQAGTLSASTLKTLGERALSRQASAEAGQSVWNAAWGDLFFSAWKAGLMGEQEEAAFASRMVEVDLEGRRVVRSGSELVLKFTVAPRLAGKEYACDFVGDSRVLEVLIDGEWKRVNPVIPPHDFIVTPGFRAATLGFYGHVERSAAMHGSMYARERYQLPELPQGPYELRMRGKWRVEMIAHAQDSRLTGQTQAADKMLERPLSPFNWSTTIQVVPRDKPVVPIVSASSKTLRDALGFQLAVARWGEGGDGHITLTTSGMSQALCLKAIVYERVNGQRTGRRWTACLETTCTARSMPHSLITYSLEPRDPRFDARRVDVELESHMDCADTAENLWEFAGIRLIWEDLPVSNTGVDVEALVPSARAERWDPARRAPIVDTSDEETGPKTPDDRVVPPG